MGITLDEAISGMIFSASGWRGIFAESGDEECPGSEISLSHKIIAAAGAKVFSDYLSLIRPGKGAVIVGRDSRPTGEALADGVIRMLLAEGREVRYLGICAAPEIMAYAETGGLARNISGRTPEMGFVYISASHNPIGHNGLKFGLNDGGVIQGWQNAALVSAFRELEEKANFGENILALLAKPGEDELRQVYKEEEQNKGVALAIYLFYLIGVFSGYEKITDNKDFYFDIEKKMRNRPLGIAVDFNGSARAVSIDREFFESLGARFYTINDEPGQIVHRIVPEGESLEPCRILLEELHQKDPSVIIGYVPDCDGDRGNLVYWDDRAGQSRIMEAQELFALACLSELAFLCHKGELKPAEKTPVAAMAAKTAVAVNDPTSFRIDKIARAFGAEVFRAEVGEANVVGLARDLRKKGYTVRILGEGSAGGVIIHPASVRDPVNTLGSIIKLLVIRSGQNTPGLYEIWCSLSGQMDKYREDFTLADIIASLPRFYSTGAYTEDAILRVKTEDQALLKERYQRVFLREWDKNKSILKEKFGIDNWQAVAYNGMAEKRKPKSFGEAGRGGLKIEFYTGEKGSSGPAPFSSIWMRGSGTEPLFRVMADAPDLAMERFLIKWQRTMVQEADSV